jgi:hypothetical protein
MFAVAGKIPCRKNQNITTARTPPKHRLEEILVRSSSESSLLEPELLESRLIQLQSTTPRVKKAKNMTA